MKEGRRHIFSRNTLAFMGYMIYEHSGQALLSAIRHQGQEGIMRLIGKLKKLLTLLQARSPQLRPDRTEMFFLAADHMCQL